MATTSTAPTLKRKAEDILVDPDTLKTIEDAKKPKIDLNADKKYSCIASIVEMYYKIIEDFHGKGQKGVTYMDVDESQIDENYEVLNSITVGNHVMSIIITAHNVSRQSVKGKDYNIIKKTKATSYKIHYKGKDHSVATDRINKLWLQVLKKNGLEYKDFDAGDDNAWYGTTGPYLDMFSLTTL